MRTAKSFALNLLLLAPVAAPVLAPPAAQPQIAINIRIGPPALPVYTQPPCPQPGYLWTPGYWAYGPAGYYWVPGVWVEPPRVGVLWTPGYWGFEGGFYGWHAGYWGPHVGFYGGVNYGFGFFGVGFGGGAWAGNVFRYNTAVVNVNTAVVRNVYVDRTVITNTTIVNHASFNGPGGVIARPTAQEQSFSREAHVQPTSNQLAHEQMARNDRSLLASENHGRPATAAMDTINGRRYNQQGRMAAGVEAGRPAAVQAANPERRTNGATPIPQERQRVNQSPNSTSKSTAPHSGANARPAPKRAEEKEERR